MEGVWGSICWRGLNQNIYRPHMTVYPRDCYQQLQTSDRKTTLPLAICQLYTPRSWSQLRCGRTTCMATGVLDYNDLFTKHILYIIDIIKVEARCRILMGHLMWINKHCSDLHDFMESHKAILTWSQLLKHQVVHTELNHKLHQALDNMFFHSWSINISTYINPLMSWPYYWNI